MANCALAAAHLGERLVVPVAGRYGYRRITALLRAEGWRVNAKRVERIWRCEGLMVPRRQPQRGRLWLNDGSCVRLRPCWPGHVWAYDFVRDRTHDGRRFRMLTVIDEYTRECLAIVVARRLREIAAVRVRYGYPRIHVLLRREGWAVNRKRVYRLYRQKGLSLRHKRPRRHVSAARRMERAAASRANEQWSMDFVSDAQFDGRRIRALTLVDNDTREALAIVVDSGIRAEHVVAALQGVTARRAPRTATADQGR